MEARELRLGNLVKIGVGVYPVRAIGENEIQAHGYSGYCTIDLVTPIPLTIAWLLKAGFKMGVVSGSYKRDGLHLPIFDKQEFGFRMQDVNPEIKYLHHLQNTFYSLTGQELAFKP